MSPLDRPEHGEQCDDALDTDRLDRLCADCWRAWTRGEEHEDRHEPEVCS